jgi:hypothetical protein
MMRNKDMKIAWLILFISAGTDFVIAAGGCLTTAIVAHGGAEMPSMAVIILCLSTGLVSGARTVGQALKSSDETSTALRGDAVPAAVPARMMRLAEEPAPAPAPAVAGQ